MSDEGIQPQHWYSTNLVGVPTPVLAIAGAREAQAGLFALLGRSRDLNEAREMFVHYLSIAFGLRLPGADELATLGAAEQRRWRSSWRKLLQGWGMDANGPAGAVLKGWVESRFGMVPLFHKAPLARFPSPLPLNGEHSASHVQLWRGSTHCEEQLVSGALHERHCRMRFNSIASYSLSRDEASCFGDWIFQVQVPRSKLLLLPGLLPGQVLQGEQEVLALGGEYDVQASYV